MVLQRNGLIALKNLAIYAGIDCLQYKWSLREKTGWNYSTGDDGIPTYFYNDWGFVILYFELTAEDLTTGEISSHAPFACFDEITVSKINGNGYFEVEPDEK